MTTNILQTRGIIKKLERHKLKRNRNHAHHNQSSVSNMIQVCVIYNVQTRTHTLCRMRFLTWFRGQRSRHCQSPYETFSHRSKKNGGRGGQGQKNQALISQMPEPKALTYACAYIKHSHHYAQTQTNLSFSLLFFFFFLGFCHFPKRTNKKRKKSQKTYTIS